MLFTAFSSLEVVITFLAFLWQWVHFQIECHFTLFWRCFSNECHWEYSYIHISNCWELSLWSYQQYHIQVWWASCILSVKDRHQALVLATLGMELLFSLQIDYRIITYRDFADWAAPFPSQAESFCVSAASLKAAVRTLIIFDAFNTQLIR